MPHVYVLHVQACMRTCPYDHAPAKTEAEVQ